MSKNKIVKNYFYNTIYQIIVLLAPLITTPYISRVLSAEGIGQYSYTQSIATYFMLIGTIGSSLYGQREIAYAQSDKVKRSKVFWEIIILRIATTLLVLIPYVLIFVRGQKYSVLYLILVIEILASGVDISWFFQGMENFKQVVLRNMIIKILSILAVFVLVKKASDVPLYTFCMTAPFLIGNLSLWFSLPQYVCKINVSIQSVVKHFIPLIILFIPQVATEVYLVLDKTMIGVLTNCASEVGYYTQAQKIVKIVLKIVTSLGTVMLPAMSFAFANNERKKIEKSICMSLRFVCLMGFPMILGIIALAEKFVPLFFGEGFSEVSILMIVITPIIMLIGISNVIGVQYLLPTKQQTAYTTSVVGGMIVNVVLNLWLIPLYGAFGASLATVCAELTVTVIQIMWMRKQLPVLRTLKSSMSYLLCAVVMYVIVSFCGSFLGNTWWELIVQGSIGIMCYALILGVIRDSLFVEFTNKIKEKLKGKFKRNL